MTKTLTTQRQQFEEWFNEEMAIRVTESNATAVRLMWKAWQASNALAANREAQPVAFTSPAQLLKYPNEQKETYGQYSEKFCVPLYTAPPAPVVNPEFTGATAVPDISALTDLIVDRLIDCSAADDDSIADAETFVYNACRAAMLAQPVSQGCNWIACSEKMPEPNKYVQVSNGVWVGIGIYNDAEHFEDDERWQDEHNEFIDLLHHPVTHWMPLPAAPEGGNGA